VETPVAGEIPGEILLRLPEWCVYLELPGRALGKDMPIQGCFAFVDWEPRFAKAELCLIADSDWDSDIWNYLIHMSILQSRRLPTWP
jgi:hypothetical protein